ncbi:MAG: tRNA (adenosine(37)-N6)-threonylcarbamoyltransferase complex dimerization subunit type 1 TsaB [Clostridia bacterium]|nr:tRNA (adenosine(37)-N6)-threonylcarbamoyltransferase complex dimerization subunit type 1 TsaB [Clostridia bacterium]
MKNFLAVDTSNSYMSVVAAKDGRIFSSFTPDCAMKHSVLLMQKIDEAFERLQMTATDCDFFAAVVGAGSFTGIRIGISAIKGFCLATGKPSLSVTSFDAMAYNAIDEATEGKILCLVDALHGSYYACGYEKGAICYPPAYISEAEVLSLQESGYTLVSSDILPIKTRLVDPTEGLKNATLALAAAGKFGELNALYIRKSSAEINAARG